MDSSSRWKSGRSERTSSIRTWYPAYAKSTAMIDSAVRRYDHVSFLRSENNGGKKAHAMSARECAIQSLRGIEQRLFSALPNGGASVAAIAGGSVSPEMRETV